MTSEDRILQITNNIAEDDLPKSTTKAELIDTINYWRDRCDAWNNLHQKRISELTEILGNHLKEPHP